MNQLVRDVKEDLKIVFEDIKLDMSILIYALRVSGILSLMVIVVPIFIGLYFAWFQTPMYKDIYTQNRNNAISYLRFTRYYPFQPYDVEAMMKHYKITYSDLDTPEILNFSLRFDNGRKGK